MPVSPRLRRSSKSLKITANTVAQSTSPSFQLPLSLTPTLAQYEYSYEVVGIARACSGQQELRLYRGIVGS